MTKLSPKLKIFSALGLYLAVALLLGANVLYSKEESSNRYSQMVFPFSSKMIYTYHHNPVENRLEIEIRGISPADLGPLDHYDEALIRRILVKDLGGMGVKVSLFLRDRDIRAMVGSFDEPFRITVDLFDREFQEKRDPETAMPFINIPAESTAAEPLADAASTLEKDLKAAPHESRLQSGRSDEPQRNPAPSSLMREPEQKRRLLQAAPQEIYRPEEMIGALGKISEGVGSAWKSYPVYVYRLQTETYKTGKDYDQWLAKNTEKALTSGQAMAQYAGELFDFGHEGRALIAYQQVLHKAPTVFENDAAHLWRLAEIHLGQGNLTLADGYYQAVVEKHPDHDLSQFARLRRLDIRALRAMEESDVVKFSALSNELDLIDTKRNGELFNQVLIRKAYWNPEDKTAMAKNLANKYHVPVFNPSIENTLIRLRKSSENAWTIFLNDTLVLNNRLLLTSKWEDETGSATALYLKSYKTKTTEPFATAIRDKFNVLFNNTLQQMFASNKNTEIIKAYENLPKELKDESLATATIWAIAESYRILGQNQNAAHYYQMASSGRKPGPDRFKSIFWTALTAGETVENLKLAPRRDAESVARYTRIRNSSDTALWKEWETLNAQEKADIYAQLKSPLEQSIVAKYLLLTPSRIVLEKWSQSLATEITAASAPAVEPDKNFSPGAATVYLIDSLAARFKALGKGKERREATALLAKIKPAVIKADQKAAKLWSESLLSLAEEYRSENQYLEAGRLYALTGRESENWEGRAEALYKGGLLLYRAGKREEALEAFKAAAEDGNNLMYADLAKKRLNQLQQ
jgi:hypothetical protein